MHTHSLFELNEHIRRVLALNFQQPIWIVAEIAQVGESRGHRYLDLVQKGEEGEVVAQAHAALWASEFRQINARFPLGLNSLLREGLELRMQLRPEFHERYGLKLHITDIDPAHTFGQLDLLRRQTIQTLRQQGLFDLNRALPLPLVLQRIAVISSETAAGKQDFLEHLGSNSFGYSFDCQVFNAAVQGKNVETEVLVALEKIGKASKRFYCVVVVRGGGARLDLMAFDGLTLCQAAATMPLPILVGIGHDIDETVLDLVAHTSLKTPTAVADFLVNHNLIFEGNILEAASDLVSLTQNILKFKHLELDRAETTAYFAAREQIQETARKLDFLAENLPAQAFQTIREQQHQLEKMEAIYLNLHPENVLQRGYSITTKNGRVIRSSSEVESGDALETRLWEGVVKSKALPMDGQF
ncbi:MAG: exodeoxyribonuclease VII large subunit [Phycisphaerae bacterium]|nr:exodeoxyribonuclease VII large subunit [Saprospiraceae bacterium]